MKRVIVVTKRSTWDQYHANPSGFGKLGKASLLRAKVSHDRQEKASDALFEALKNLGVKPWVVQGAEVAFDAVGARLVITLGGDGTLLAASHHVGKGVPLLGINSDPDYSVGHFCTMSVDDSIERRLAKVLERPKTIEVTRMLVRVGRKMVAKRVLNEALFSHTCPAAMTRFNLSVPSSEVFACSGVWIGTGAGSTGAIASAGGVVEPSTSKRLQAVVREPVKERPWGNAFMAQTFTLTSKCPDATLYLDGPFLRVPVNFDEKVSFMVSPDHLSLVEL